MNLKNDIGYMLLLVVCFVLFLFSIHIANESSLDRTKYEEEITQLREENDRLLSILEEK